MPSLSPSRKVPLCHFMRGRTLLRPASGFTLVELLIVVAIISILAAIAVPNMLEAQIRSKVSRAKADMRTLSFALEAYRTDNNHYPETYVTTRWQRFIMLTTPIAYISSVPRDPFNVVNDGDNLGDWNPFPSRLIRDSVGRCFSETIRISTI